MIKCLLFDCDGTLVDSEYLGHLALEMHLRTVDIEVSASKLMAQHRGGKLGDIIKSLEKEHNKILDEDFILGFRKEISQLFENELQAIEGINEALKQINLPICVASGGPRAKIEQSLGLTNLKHYFGDNIFSSYEVNSWKPDPYLFLHAANVMGFLPKHCAVIEDSPIGVEAALAANMIPIFYNPSALQVPEGNVVSINHMRELQGAILDITH